MADPVDYRVLVAGSGYWHARLKMWQTLDELLFDARAEVEGCRFVVAYPSDAPLPGQRGVAQLAGRWALYMASKGYPTAHEPHPALWDAPCRPGCPGQHRRMIEGNRSICPRAGAYRNTELIAGGARIMQEFLVRGTRIPAVEDLRERAREAGIELRAPVLDDPKGSAPPPRQRVLAGAAVRRGIISRTRNSGRP